MAGNIGIEYSCALTCVSRFYPPRLTYCCVNARGVNVNARAEENSFITDATGTAIQHLEYLPYGELWVNQQSGSFDSRYKFSAKELDDETAYSYFGARYYDSDLSVWLSVDPMASKYPHLSPFNYCMNSPLKFIDPNGEDVRIKGGASRNWVGTFFRVAYDYVTDKGFRKRLNSERKDNTNTYVYMESENAQYSRPKDATNTDSHTATVQNDVPMLFNTRVKKSKYSNSGMDNLTDNINLNQDSKVNLSLVTKMKIKLDYTTYQEPDRIVLNNNGNPTIDTRVGVTTGNKSMTNRCKIQMSPTPNLQVSINRTIPQTMDPRASQHSGFDYSLTVKFKLY